MASLTIISHTFFILCGNRMPSKTRKNKKGRKGPQTSATAFPEGKIEFGNDKQRWVVKQTDTGVKRWVPFYSASLFGYTPLTAKILAKHRTKPIAVYEKMISLDTWPKKAKEFDVHYTFTPSGDAERGGKVFTNWLKDKTPPVKTNDLFIINGTMKSRDVDAPLKVAPLPGELVSTNLMNTDAFIKV